jgi:hypothetical protein
MTLLLMMTMMMMMMMMMMIAMKSKKMIITTMTTLKINNNGDCSGRPPEDGEEEFHNELSGGWLHLDQTSRRIGLHAYQGAVYLEDADQDDWTFEVKRSYRHIKFS